MNREDIIKNNDKYGIKTVFYEDEQDILGYSLGNTIYLNTNSTGDLELVSKHELFHFFEETEKFTETKELLLNLLEQDGTIKALRVEYSLKYDGLYTDEEIENGIIDTEIVIDLLAGNSKHSTEFIRQLGDGILNQVAREVLEKRYLVLNLRKNVASMTDLSMWEKIFIENYYNQVNYDGITPTLNSNDRQEQVRKDIQNELKKLYELPLETFTISSNSKEVIREFESELKALEARGEGTRAEQVRNSKEDSCQKLAEMFSAKLYEEFKHIVDFIKGKKYEAAFKALVLRETLLKTYKKDKGNILVGKRKLNETIKGHMVLNETTLEVMVNRVNDFDNFMDLYFASLEEFNKVVAEKGKVSLDNVETYGKGHWIKFEGKGSDPEGYLNNAQELTALVQDTPWCTKTLAATQLEQGDFYVFVDNENKPHIAVKLTGNTIDEVRGILNNNAQELESDYRDVAISFLENNKSINGGKEWYEKESWNKRLVKYIEKIENGTFNETEIESLLKDMCEHDDYKSHAGEENSNLVKLKERLILIKDKIARYYNCFENEICIGDYIPGDEKVCPYKIILGNANLKNSKVLDLGGLRIVMNDFNVIGTEIMNLGDLESVGGYLQENGKIQNYGKLKHVGKGGFLRSQILYSNDEELDKYIIWNKNLLRYNEEIDNGTFNDEEIENLLSDIGYKEHDNPNYFVKHKNNPNLVKLKSKIGLIKDKIAKYYNCSEDKICVGDYIPGDEKVCPYKIIYGNANLENSQVVDLGDLESIKDNLVIRRSRVEVFGKLKYIGGEIHYNGGKAHFTYKQFNEYVYEWYKKIIKNIDEFNTKNNSKAENEISLEDIIEFSSDFKNFNLVNLRKKINSIKDKIAKYYNCSEDEICVGDYIPGDEKECPYKVILGAASFGKQIISLKNIKYIGGSVNFYSSGVTDLGDLQVIGGDANFSISQITSLGNLESIGGEANFRESEVIDLGSLRSIGGTANFSWSKVRSLGNLESIGGDFYFIMSPITSLANLKSIGGNVDFGNTSITSLANLESIGGDVDFSYSKITDFGNLRYVGGKVTFNNPEQEKLYYEHMARMHGNKPEGMHL